ncbi:MAG: HEPN domain-containing protein [Niameybacter sp.]|uniref:HEPN domain-containing protein n=1 Tax=Niameybacter sp. TaxID=2033640 RepID=UPI002FC9C6FF
MISLLELAKYDMRTAQLVITTNTDEGAIRHGAYLTQQAVEKTLKFILSELRQTYPLTHNIQDLVVKLNGLGIEIPSEIVGMALVLTSWEAKSRYAGNFSANFKQVSQAIRIANEFILDIEKAHVDGLLKINNNI